MRKPYSLNIRIISFILLLVFTLSTISDGLVYARQPDPQAVIFTTPSLNRPLVSTTGFKNTPLGDAINDSQRKFVDVYERFKEGGYSLRPSQMSTDGEFQRQVDMLWKKLRKTAEFNPQEFSQDIAEFEEKYNCLISPIINMDSLGGIRDRLSLFKEIVDFNFDGVVITEIGELTTNAVKHGDYGFILVRILEDSENERYKKGAIDQLTLDITVIDKGKGIQKIKKALKRGFTTSLTPSLGVGLNILDEDPFKVEFTISSVRRGKSTGTKIRFRRGMPPQPARDTLKFATQNFNYHNLPTINRVCNDTQIQGLLAQINERRSGLTNILISTAAMILDFSKSQKEVIKYLRDYLEEIKLADKGIEYIKGYPSQTKKLPFGVSSDFAGIFDDRCYGPLSSLFLAIKSGYCSYEISTNFNFMNYNAWFAMHYDTNLRNIIKELAQAHKIELSLHAPIIDNMLPAIGVIPTQEMIFKAYQDTIDLASDVGAKHIVVHIGGLYEKDLLIRTLTYARQKGVMLVFENSKSTLSRGGYITATQFIDALEGFIIEGFTGKDFGVCIDLAHFNLSNEDAISGIYKLLKWAKDVSVDVKKVHLNQNCGVSQPFYGSSDCHRPIDTKGTVPIEAVIAMLRKFRFKPDYILEHDGHITSDAKRMLEDFLKRHLYATNLFDIKTGIFELEYTRRGLIPEFFNKWDQSEKEAYSFVMITFGKDMVNRLLIKKKVADILKLHNLSDEVGARILEILSDLDLDLQMYLVSGQESVFQVILKGIISPEGVNKAGINKFTDTLKSSIYKVESRYERQRLDKRVCALKEYRDNLQGLLQKLGGKTFLGRQKAKIPFRTVVLSDIHGNAARLHQALCEIGIIIKGNDIVIDKDRFADNTQIFIAGDFFDEGQHSITDDGDIPSIIKQLKMLKEKLGSKVKLTMGNHEIYLIKAVLFSDLTALKYWMQARGGTVLKELGIDTGNIHDVHFNNDVAQFYIDEVQKNKKFVEDVDWLRRNIDVASKSEGNFFFIMHGGIPVDREGMLDVEFEGKKGFSAVNRINEVLKLDISNEDNKVRVKRLLDLVDFNFYDGAYCTDNGTGQTLVSPGDIFYEGRPVSWLYVLSRVGVNKVFDANGFFVLAKGHISELSRDIRQIGQVKTRDEARRTREKFEKVYWAKRIISADFFMSSGLGGYIVFDNDGLRVRMLDKDEPLLNVESDRIARLLARKIRDLGAKIFELSVRLRFFSGAMTKSDDIGMEEDISSFIDDGYAHTLPSGPQDLNASGHGQIKASSLAESIHQDALESQPRLVDENGNGPSCLQAFVKDPKYRGKITREGVTDVEQIKLMVDNLALMVEIQIDNRPIKFFIDKRFIEYGYTEEIIQQLIKDAVTKSMQIRGPDCFKGIDVSRPITIAILDKSLALFENHKQDGFIGINKILFDPKLSAIRSTLLQIGISHELRHEAGMTNSEEDESVLTDEDIIMLINYGIDIKEAHKLLLPLAEGKFLEMISLIDDFLYRHLSFPVYGLYKGDVRQMLPRLRALTPKFGKDVPGGRIDKDVFLYCAGANRMIDEGIYSDQAMRLVVLDIVRKFRKAGSWVTSVVLVDDPELMIKSEDTWAVSIADGVTLFLFYPMLQNMDIEKAVSQQVSVVRAVSAMRTNMPPEDLGKTAGLTIEQTDYRNIADKYKLKDILNNIEERVIKDNYAKLIFKKRVDDFIENDIAAYRKRIQDHVQSSLRGASIFGRKQLSEGVVDIIGDFSNDYMKSLVNDLLEHEDDKYICGLLKRVYMAVVEVLEECHAGLGFITSVDINYVSNLTYYCNVLGECDNTIRYGQRALELIGMVKKRIRFGSEDWGNFDTEEADACQFVAASYYFKALLTLEKFEKNWQRNVRLYYEKALEYFDRLETVLKDDPRLLVINLTSDFRRGVVNEELGNLEKALSLFRNVERIYERYTEEDGAKDEMMMLTAIAKAHISRLLLRHIRPFDKETALRASEESLDLCDNVQVHNERYFGKDKGFIYAQRSVALLNRSATFNVDNALKALSVLEKDPSMLYSEEVCRLLINIYRDLGIFYREHNDSEKSLSAFKKAYEYVDRYSIIEDKRVVEIYKYSIDMVNNKISPEDFIERMKSLGEQDITHTVNMFLVYAYIKANKRRPARDLLMAIFKSHKPIITSVDSLTNVIGTWYANFMLRSDLAGLIKEVLLDPKEKDAYFKERLINFLMRVDPESAVVFLDELLEAVENTKGGYGKDYLNIVRGSIAKLELHLTQGQWVNRIGALYQKGRWSLVVDAYNKIPHEKLSDMSQDNAVRLKDYIDMANDQIEKAAVFSELLNKIRNAYESAQFDKAKELVSDGLTMEPSYPKLLELKRKIEIILLARDLYWRGQYKDACDTIAPLIVVTNGASIDPVVSAFKERIESVITAQELVAQGRPEAAGQLLDVGFTKYPQDKEFAPGDVLKAALENINLVRRKNEEAEAARRSPDINRIVTLAEEILTLDKENLAIVRLLISAAQDSLNSKKFEDARVLAEAILNFVEPNFTREPSVHQKARLIIRQAYAGSLLNDFEIARNILKAWLLAQENAEKRAKDDNIESWIFENGRLERTPKGFILKNVKLLKKDGSIEAIHNLRDIPLFRGESCMFFEKENGSQGNQQKDEMDKPGRFFELVNIGRDSLEFEFSEGDDPEIVSMFINHLQNRGGVFKKMHDKVTEMQLQCLDDAITASRAVLKTGQAPMGYNKKVCMALGLEDIPASSLLNKDAFTIKFQETGIKYDESQKSAISAILNTDIPVTFVHGPPGTGKTSVIVESVRHLIQQGKRVLVLSQSNTAVNNVGERLVDKEGNWLVPFVRLGNDETVISKKIRKFWSYQNGGWQVKKLLDQYKPKRKGFVVLGTLNGFRNDRIIQQVKAKGVQLFNDYDVVIVEEASRATIAESLLGITLAKEKIVFVGDHKQLPAHGLGTERIDAIRDEVDKHGLGLPVRFDDVFSEENIENERISLFERRIIQHERTPQLNYHLLRVNRRSHWAIATLVNILTYLRQLIHKDEDKPRLQWAALETDTFLPIDTIHYGFSADEEKDGKSYKNLGEVSYVLESVDWILNQTIIDPATGQIVYRYKPEDIFIITPYKAQIRAINEALRLKAQLNDEEAKALGLPLDNPEREDIIRQIRLKRDSLSHNYNLNCLGGRRLTEDMLDNMGMDILTADSVQGHENKVVILSLVRSNKERPVLGFYATIDGLQRLNVAISRAKEKLIVIGDFTNTLTKGRVFGRYLPHEYIKRKTLNEKAVMFFKGMVTHYNYLKVNFKQVAPSFSEGFNMPLWAPNRRVSSDGNRMYMQAFIKDDITDSQGRPYKGEITRDGQTDIEQIKLMVDSLELMVEIQIDNRPIKLFIDKRFIEYGYTKEKLQELIEEAIKIRGPGKFKNIDPDQPITLAILDKSTSLFEDHKQNNFIGINKILFDSNYPLSLPRRLASRRSRGQAGLSRHQADAIPASPAGGPASPARLAAKPRAGGPVSPSGGRSTLLKVGISHELRHEDGFDDEALLTFEDAEMIMDLLGADIEKTEYLIEVLRSVVHDKGFLKLLTLKDKINRLRKRKPILEEVGALFYNISMEMSILISEGNITNEEVMPALKEKVMSDENIKRLLNEKLISTDDIDNLLQDRVSKLFKIEKEGKSGKEISLINMRTFAHDIVASVANLSGCYRLINLLQNEQIANDDKDRFDNLEQIARCLRSLLYNVKEACYYGPTYEGLDIKERNEVVSLFADYILSLHDAPIFDRRQYLNLISQYSQDRDFCEYIEIILIVINDLFNKPYNFLHKADNLYCENIEIDRLIPKLEDLAQILKNRNAKRNISIDFIKGQGFPDSIYVDVYKFTEILQNLIDNAVSFTQDLGGRITITFIRTKAGQIEVSVSDNGRGINAKDLPHIFDEGYSVRTEEEKRFESGTGYGLWICKKLVELCGGSINAQSDAGETIFKIVLPQPVIDDGSLAVEEAIQGCIPVALPQSMDVVAPEAEIQV